MDNKEDIIKLSLPNRISALESLNTGLGSLAALWDLPASYVMTLTLVLEEAFTNVVKYAYEDKQDHTIDILFEKNGSQLIITTIDDGRHYDPTLKESPNIELTAEEREIGGLGIYLIRKMMDKVSYQRKDELNYFRMESRIPEN